MQTAPIIEESPRRLFHVFRGILCYELVLVQKVGHTFRLRIARA
jgi:hypothetical protein